MAKIEGDILIKAPKEKAWAFLTDVEKLPDWMPLLTEVSDVQGEGVGRSYNWGYKFMGIKFKGKNKYYMNYHWRVFRAKAETARLTVSDWKSGEERGGPVGQELMYNFIEIQPYIGD